MGIVAEVLDFLRQQLDGGEHISETKADPGSGDNLTAVHFGAPGDDSHPLPGDQVVLVPSPGSGHLVAVGYLDAVNEPQAGPGERRLYSRDADGKAVTVWWLKADGTVELSNADGTITMAPGGDITLNGVTIDVNGNVTAPGEVTAMDGAAAVKLSTHLHPTAVGPTDKPTPGT